MGRIHTPFVTAEMVDLTVRRNRTNPQFIRNSVGIAWYPIDRRKLSIAVRLA